MGVIRGCLETWTEGVSGYGDGYGNGSGSGSGSGSGNGDGDGSGYGSGSGSGYGYGDGSGYGNGSGSGSGYGDGDGYGDGNGNGYGSGYGSGYGYWIRLADPLIKSINDHPGFIAFWRSDSDGKPANGGSSSKPAYVGMVQEISRPLTICTKNGLHGTLDPGKWKGDRIWLVALYGEIQRDGDKVAALKREILAEVK